MRDFNRRELLRNVAVSAAALTVASRFAEAQAGKIKIRTAINPILFGFLPVILGIENGRFAEAGLDIDVKRFTSSAVTQMPSVARGDLDITQIVAGPPLFNQHSEGFDIKIICSTIEAHSGWADNLCVIVRKDLWDSGAIRKIADLRGHRIDGATTGSPTNYLINRTLVKAGLTYDDVTYSSRLRTPPDTLAALQNKAIDAVASVEPEATAIVDKGIGVRLATTQDVIPDLQNGFLVASADYIAKNRATVVRFLKACLLTEQEIVKNGTTFTPDVIKILQRWTELPLDLLQKLAPPYFGQYGSINVKSLKDQQAYWQSKNLLPQNVDVDSMIDGSMLDEARAALGIH